MSATRSTPSMGSYASGNGASGTSLAHMLSNMMTSKPEYTLLYYYKSSSTQWYLFLIASVASFGIVPLVCMWFPQFYTQLTKQQVASMESGADFVLAKLETSTHTTYEECQIQQLESMEGKYFIYRKSRHFYDPKKQIFVRLQNEISETYGELMQRTKNGLPIGQSTLFRTIYGPNDIDLTPQAWQKILLRKIIHPFYLFQVASALIWLNEDYTTYALLIMFMSAVSIIWEVYTQVSNETKLHNLVKNDSSVKVVRDGHVQSIGVSQLVVGDVVVVEDGMVPADLLILHGECTADESTLTGEAIPISKHFLQPQSPDTRMEVQPLKTKSKECVLYAGSTILFTKTDTRAIVLATGFSTSKGELFRSILYPKPLLFKMEQDSYRFMAVLSLIAFLAFIKRLVQASHSSNVTGAEAFLSALDLVTIAVPPALPLVLTVGIGFALTRLEAASIYCINSQRINVAGHVDCFCFDKTGTLSSDHLDFQGVDECSTTSTTFIGLQNEVEVLSLNGLIGLATCHGLNEHNGQITGYALEKDMFRATGYSIETNIHKRTTPNAPFSILISSPIGKTFGIVKRYLFDASLQRSSVLIEDFESGQRVVYTKGSPEAMQLICNPASIPSNYAEKARAYSYQGYYVVALASKTYPVTADVPVREAMECRLQFIGFVLFLNKIKTESPYVINTLEEASVDVRMITGDNAFTAIHVSRKINMSLQSTIWLMDVDESKKEINSPTKRLVYADVDELATQSIPPWTTVDPKTFMNLTENNTLAMTGQALEQLVEMNVSCLDQLIMQTKIFSRIRPQQKTFIIETLIRCGKIVGMVGDGTNDCGALKAAHIGIALSDADASIVAPFTSRQKLITDVVDLLREGRCALSTSFVAFKYMVLYSIIQLTLSSLMNDYSSQMSNNQYLFDDLVVVFGLSVLMVRTAAAERLTKELPAKTLFAPSILLSLSGQILIMFMCVGIALSSAKTKTWYCSAAHAYELTTNHSEIVSPCYYFQPGSPPDLTQHSYENSVLWLFGHLQYWIVALVFNLNDIFRLSLVSNKFYTFYLFLLFIILQIQLFSYKSEQTVAKVGVDTSFGVLRIPSSFCTSLFFLFLFDVFLAVMWERFVVGFILYRIEVRQQSGSWFGRTVPSSVAYVADRDSLLAKKGGVVLTVDDGDDEEEDVLNKSTDIVYVSYDSS